MKSLLILIEKFDFTFWWPVDLLYHEKTNGDWRVEVIIGAILTQNTKWNIVEKNIEYLKSKGFIFDLENILKLDLDDIKVPMKVRKLETLKNLAKNILENFSSIEEMKKEDLSNLRKFLLNLKGIGYETCDVILLYSLEKPIFVVDNYTKKFLYYNKEINEINISYERLRKMIEEFIKDRYNEILSIFRKKIEKISCKEVLNYYFKKSYGDLPLNPCSLSDNFENNLVIIYKELHGMIDIFIKTGNKEIK